MRKLHYFLGIMGIATLTLTTSCKNNNQNVAATTATTKNIYFPTSLIIILTKRYTAVNCEYTKNSRKTDKKCQ